METKILKIKLFFVRILAFIFCKLQKKDDNTNNLKMFFEFAQISYEKTKSFDDFFLNFITYSVQTYLSLKKENFKDLLNKLGNNNYVFKFDNELNLKCISKDSKEYNFNTIYANNKHVKEYLNTQIKILDFEIKNAETYLARELVVKKHYLIYDVIEDFIY